MWDFSLRSLSRCKFTFRFLYVYPDHNKLPDFLHIRFLHHRPQALFHFLGPPTKLLTLSLNGCEHPLVWQNIKTIMYLDSYFFSVSDLLHSTVPLSLLSICMVSLVSFLPPPLHFFPFCLIIFSVAFLFCKLCLQGVYTMSLRTTLNFQQKVLLEDRETVNIENPFISW